MFLSLKFKNLTGKSKVLGDRSAGSYRKNKIFKPKLKDLAYLYVFCTQSQGKLSNFKFENVCQPLCFSPKVYIITLFPDVCNKKYLIFRLRPIADPDRNDFLTAFESKLLISCLGMN